MSDKKNSPSASENNSDEEHNKPLKKSVKRKLSPSCAKPSSTSHEKYSQKSIDSSESFRLPDSSEETSEYSYPYPRRNPSISEKDSLMEEDTEESPCSPVKISEIKDEKMLRQPAQRPQTLPLDNPILKSSIHTFKIESCKSSSEETDVGGNQLEDMTLSDSSKDSYTISKLKSKNVEDKSEETSSGSFNRFGMTRSKSMMDISSVLERGEKGIGAASSESSSSQTDIAKKESEKLEPLTTEHSCKAHFSRRHLLIEQRSSSGSFGDISDQEVDADDTRRKRKLAKEEKEPHTHYAKSVQERRKLFKRQAHLDTSESISTEEIHGETKEEILTVGKYVRMESITTESEEVGKESQETENKSAGSEKASLEIISSEISGADCESTDIDKDITLSTDPCSSTSKAPTGTVLSLHKKATQPSDRPGGSTPYSKCTLDCKPISTAGATKESNIRFKATNKNNESDTVSGSQRNVQMDENEPSNSNAPNLLSEPSGSKPVDIPAATSSLASAVLKSKTRSHDRNIYGSLQKPGESVTQPPSVIPIIGGPTTSQDSSSPHQFCRSEPATRPRDEGQFRIGMTQSQTILKILQKTQEQNEQNKIMEEKSDARRQKEQARRRKVQETLKIKIRKDENSSESDDNED